MAAYARRRSIGCGCQDPETESQDGGVFSVFRPLKQARLSFQAKADQLRSGRQPAQRRRACFAVITFPTPSAGVSTLLPSWTLLGFHSRVIFEDCDLLLGLIDGAAASDTYTAPEVLHHCASCRGLAHM